MCARQAGTPLPAFAGTQETVTKPWKAAAHGRNRHLGNDRVAGTSHLMLFPGMLLPVPERGVADLLIYLQQAAAAAPKILGRIIVFPRHAWFTRKKNQPLPTTDALAYDTPSSSEILEENNERIWISHSGGNNKGPK
jgi:hypothetical protein